MGKFWTAIIVMAAIMTIASEAAGAQTIDSNGRCHDATGKYAPKSVCEGSEAGASKTSDSKPNDSSKPSGDDSFEANSAASKGAGKVQAEDGSWVDPNFWDKTDTQAVSAVKAISDTDTGNGYFLYAYDRNSGAFCAAVTGDAKKADAWVKKAVEKGWSTAQVYFATGDAKSVANETSSKGKNGDCKQSAKTMKK